MAARGIGMDALKQIIAVGEIAAWQQVPVLVASRYKEAADVQKQIRKVIRYLPRQSDYGFCFWNPETKTVWAVLGDSDEESTHQKWHNSLKAIPGVRSVKTEAETGPYGDDNWIRIKAANLSWLNKPYQLAGVATGGPSPFSNAIVSSLLGAGLGYGGGWLAEQLLPEQYFEKGKLRRNAALLGAAGGALSQVPNAFANMTINHRSTGKPQVLKSIFAGDSHQTLTPEVQQFQDFMRGDGRIKANEWVKIRQDAKKLPRPDAVFQKLAVSTGLDMMKPVPVDAFNRAIWNDVHNGAGSARANPYGTRDIYSDNSDQMHTPPVNAAAVTGLVSGVQQMYGNPSLLSPRHFISGLSNAGLDMVTARVAGGVLGALGGLKPEAQKKLQDLGVWSGMIRGVTGSVFGLR